MTDGEILSLLREFLWAAAIISMPLLVTALVVGMVVGLFQALTSIQEMTLTFVPKIAVMLLVFFLSSGFMARVAINMFDNEVIPVIAR
jgi:flagellar biosynthetic protein FliQ